MQFPFLNSNFSYPVEYSFDERLLPGSSPPYSSFITDPGDIIDDIRDGEFDLDEPAWLYKSPKSSFSAHSFFGERFVNSDSSTILDMVDEYITQLLEWISSVLPSFSPNLNFDASAWGHDVPSSYNNGFQKQTSYPGFSAPALYSYSSAPPLSSAPLSSTPLVSVPDTPPYSHSSSNPFDPNPQVGPLTPEEGRAMAVKVARQLMIDFPGMTKEQAAGVVGNLWHESAGMNANVNEFGSGPPDQTYGAPNGSQFGYGWAQWTGSRKWDYINFCKRAGLDPRSPAANYAFLLHELKNGEADGTPSSLPYILAAKTVDEAAYAFRQKYERATMPVDSERLKHARELYSLL